MPLIPAQPTPPARDTLSLRLDHDLHEQLRAYAEFIGGAKDYVISHAIRRVLRQDKEFTAWLQTRAQQPPGSDTSDNHQAAAEAEERRGAAAIPLLQSPTSKLKQP